MSDITAPTTIATAINTLVREDDLLQHIQDELTVNAIRDGKLVEVRWADLSEDEQRAAYCSTFHIYEGCSND